MKTCFKTSCFFACWSCQNTVNTSVVGWFALRTGSRKNEENRGIRGTF